MGNTRTRGNGTVEMERLITYERKENQSRKLLEKVRDGMIKNKTKQNNNNKKTTEEKIHPRSLGS